MHSKKLHYLLIFLLDANLNATWEQVGQNTTPTRHKIPQLEPQDIRESSLDFTVHLSEIKPDIPILQTGAVWIRKSFFCLFSLCSEKSMKRSLNLRFQRHYIQERNTASVFGALMQRIPIKLILD